MAKGEMNCKQAAALFQSYLEEATADAETDALEGHLSHCSKCSAALQEMSAAFAPEGSEDTAEAVQDALDEPEEEDAADGPGATEGDAEELAPVAAESGFMGWMVTQTPWWGVSIVLHVLLITLIGLVTWTVRDLSQDDLVVVVTTLEARKDFKLNDDLKPKVESKNSLEAKHDTPATDPDSNVASDVVVPPDILAKAELGDHFETINLDRPDTKSAFGNPDAKMFHSVHGDDSAAGGGGAGGASLDSLIGVGLSGSPGTGGGWGGGNGTGVGVGDGPGRGSFGMRSGGGRKLMVMRHGGSKATEGAVDRALQWLARHQEQDGHWDCEKYGGAKHDVAATGFAVLAFLGAGHTERAGKYRDNVQRGVYWLISMMKDDGRWDSNNYVQGIAALAVAEAAGMGRVPDTVKAAQKAIDGVIAGQHEYAAWDYGPNPNTDARNDSSVSGWCVMALKSGKIAGLKVDHKGFAGAIAWLDAGQDLENAKDAGTGYEGGKMSYAGTLKVPNKGKGSIAVTGSAAIQRMFMGWKADDPAVLGPCNLFLKQLPKSGEGGKGRNLYYWYYATLVMFQQGGEHWKTWNEAMKPSLCDNQRKGGDEDGSWDPVGAYGDRWGRVGETSIATLCLEVYYRYLPLYKK